MRKDMIIKAIILGLILIPLALWFVAAASAVVPEPIKTRKTESGIVEMGKDMLDYLRRDEAREINR